jgi:hypothetical protein
MVKGFCFIGLAAMGCCAAVACFDPLRTDSGEAPGPDASLDAMDGAAPDALPADSGSDARADAGSGPAASRLWIFDDRTGEVEADGIPLDARRSYQMGPCAIDGGCRLDTACFLVAGNGRLSESVTSLGRAWTFDFETGDAWDNAWQGADLASIARYAASTGPCYGAAAFGCRFETRTFFLRNNGRLIESITAYGKIFNFDAYSDAPWLGGNDSPANGTDLTAVTRYVAGPCAGRPPGGCVFDTRVFTTGDAGVVESITAYGRVWDFDTTNDTPVNVGGTDLRDDFRWARGPCKEAGPCALVTRAVLETPDGGREDWVTR